MKIAKENYTYEESFWSGRTCFLIDNQECERIDQNNFILKNENKEIKIHLEGNLLFGLTAYIDKEKVILTNKIKWYEWLLSICFLSFIVYNYIIGAIIGGIMGVVNLVLMRSVQKPIYKILISLLIFTFSFGLCALIVLLFSL